MDTQNIFAMISSMKPLLAITFRIVITLILAYVVIRLLKPTTLGVQRIMGAKYRSTSDELARRSQTLSSILNSVIKIAVVITAGMMILKELGLDIRPLLATAGVGALALGFGAQNLIKDYFNGFILILENQFRINDWVTVGGVTGEVQSINMRTTILRDLEGREHVIPNGEISTVCNLTKQWARIVLDMGVAYKENVDKVIEVLQKILAEMLADPEWAPTLLEPLEVAGVQRFSDSSVDIRIWGKTAPGKQWAVKREINRRIKNKFDEVGIEIPFPHRTLYLGADVTLPIQKVA